MRRRPINEKVIFGLTLLAATAALIDARDYPRGTAQFMNTWSPLALDMFVGAQIVTGFLFLLFGLAGVHMHRSLFTVCCLTTSILVTVSFYYVLSTPDTSKVALAYEAGFLAILFWHLFFRPREVWP